jgi:hypothetical protein
MRFKEIDRPFCPYRDNVEREATEMKIKIIEKNDKHIIKFLSKKGKVIHIIYYYPKTKKFYDPDFRQEGKGKYVKYYLSGWAMGYLTCDKEAIYPAKGKHGVWKIEKYEEGDKARCRIIFHKKTETYFKQIQFYFNDDDYLNNEKKWTNYPLISMKII